MKEKIAKTVSFIFNAYFSFLGANLLIILTEKDSIPNYLFIIGLLISLRAIQVFLFKKFNLISDLDMSDRRERPLFNFVSLIPSAIFVVIATTTSSELFLSLTLINFTLELIIGIISIFWKISGHMTYLAYLSMTLLYLYFSWPLLIGIILLVPTVGWSRVLLKKHTVWQVIAGTILGTLVPLFLL